MSTKYEELLRKVSEQQQGKEFTDIFMVGEQIKDICRNNEKATELVVPDLDVPEMSLERCAAKIKEESDRLHKEHKGGCICIPPNVAEGIIRKFYGIPDGTAEETVLPGEKSTDNIIRLEDFI